MLRVRTGAGGKPPGWRMPMFPQVELSTIQPFLSLPGLLGATLKSKGNKKEIFCRHKQMLHWQVSETEDGSLKHNRWADYCLKSGCRSFGLGTSPVVSRLQFWVKKTRPRLIYSHIDKNSKPQPNNTLCSQMHMKALKLNKIFKEHSILFSSILFSTGTISVYIPTNRGSFRHILCCIYCRFFCWWPFWPVWGDTLL